MNAEQKALREGIADKLATEAGYGRVAADGLGRSWAQLGRDRDWSDELTTRVAMDAATVGLLPDAVRAATQLVDDAESALDALGVTAASKRTRPVKATGGRAPQTR